MNELRQDISSGDWVIIAPGRASRPLFLEKKKSARTPSPKKLCPFEDLQKTGNWPPILSYPSAEKWRMVLIPNKYPALTSGQGCAVPMTHGIYQAKSGLGQHELIITRDHNKNFSELSSGDAFALLKMFQNRYHMASVDPCNVYISAFFNWGAQAGASVWHPHYQILVLPILPPHITHSLRNSEAYFKKHHRCVRCDIIKNELKEGKRIVEQNKSAVAFTPYASKTPFEVSIMPKKHLPYFSMTSPEVLKDMTALLQSVMRRMKKNVNDPDLNVFIHGAPLFRKESKEQYHHHHWHIEVSPRISTHAGFELSTGIDINIVDPDVAAAMLRGKK